MKTRIMAVAAALVASTILATSTHAQVRAKADIPFEFTVGNKVLSPGEYDVQRALESNKQAQLIRRTDGSSGVIVLTTPVDASGKKTEPCLVFHRYGNEYFLSQIWLSQGLGLQLSESRREKELAGGKAPAIVALAFPMQSIQR